MPTHGHIAGTSVLSQLRATSSYRESLNVLKTLPKDASESYVAESMRFDIGPIDQVEAEHQALKALEPLQLSLAPRPLEYLAKDENYAILVTAFGQQSDQSLRKEDFGYQPDFKLSAQAKESALADLEKLLQAGLFQGALERLGCWYVHNATDQLVILPWFRLDASPQPYELEEMSAQFRKMVQLS